MADVKPPATYDEQIAKLVSRGCAVQDKERTQKILAQVNYYRLSAYFLPFKKPDETYIEGTKFEKIYQIYEFDRKMRLMLFSAIEEIEVFLRSTLAYYHARKYGALGYLDNKNYYPKHRHTDFIAKINAEKEKRIKEPFVQHHIEKYGGNFPIWVMIELFTFGTLSHFYADLPIGDQKYISRNFFSTYPKALASWLRCCTDLRNFCAHFGRLYYRRFTSVPAEINELSTGNDRSLFAMIMVLRGLYTDSAKWNKEILLPLRDIVCAYRDDIQLRYIGFPDNWETLLKKDIDGQNG